MHLNVYNNVHLNGHQNGPQNVDLNDHINILRDQVKVENEVWSFHYFFGRVGGGWVC